MQLPRKTCPCCGKSVATYDTRREGWKRVPCEPWFAGHKCPHKHDCFPDNPDLNDCTECSPPKEESHAMFKKGQRVVRVLSCGGIETAVICEVTSCKKGVVMVDDYSTKHDAKTGREVEPSGLGSVRLICIEGEE